MEQNKTDQIEDLKSDADSAKNAAVFLLGVSLSLLATNVALVIALFISLAGC